MKDIVVAASIIAIIMCAPAFGKGLSKQYGSCMDAASSNAQMHDCVDVETKRQDAALNQNYQAAMKALSPARKQAMLSAQRAWLAYRKAETDFTADPDGGTAAPLNADIEFLTITQARADSLEGVGQ